MKQVNNSYPALLAAILALLLTCAASTVLAMDSKPQRQGDIAPSSKYKVAGLSENKTISKGMFLVAKPRLQDPRFKETVVLIISHKANDGAVGVIINRPTDILLSKALPEVEELKGHAETIFIGGPVSQYSLVLLFTSHEAPEIAEHLFGDVYVSSSMAGLNSIITKPGLADTMRAYAGYAGWAPGQLEAEIERGDWRPVRAASVDIFDTPPETIWRNFMERFEQRWVKENVNQYLMVSIRR